MSDSTTAGWKVPADDSGSWSGLLIEWRRGPAGWLALVIYIVTDGITSTTIQGGSLRRASDRPEHLLSSVIRVTHDHAADV